MNIVSKEHFLLCFEVYTCAFIFEQTLAKKIKRILYEALQKFVYLPASKIILESG
jgi:hypothetical protein